MKRYKKKQLALVGILAMASVTRSELEIARHTIDGGGMMRTSGGPFELSGTIGQHDAGGVLTGGDFILTGGFWFEAPPGDCNFDGIVGLLDLDTFADCLAGPADGIDAGCGCFDNNRNGAIDLADFSASQWNFVGE